MDPAIEIGIRVPACVPVPQLADFIARAEAAGFAFVAMPDVQTIARDPFIALAAAAARTERIGLYVTVTNPMTRHVSVLACLARTVAELAPGRFAVVLGRGDNAVRSVGLPSATLAQLREAVRDLRSLVRGDETVLAGRPVRMDFGGRGVPIYVAATGPQAIVLAGEVGDGALIQVANVAAARRTARDLLAAGAAAAGRTMESFAVIWGVVPAIVTSDMSAAWAEAHAYCASWALMPERAAWLREAGVELPEFSMPPELAHIRPDIAHAEDPEDVRRATPFLTRDIVARICDTMGFFGTPDHCAGRLAALAREGVRKICVRGMSTYALPEALVASFGAEVLPRLRALLRA